MRRAQNSRQDLDQAREENQESQRGECRESLREGKRHPAYFVVAIPTLEDGAAENDSRKERREHERKGIRGAAELRRKQASPADFIRHSRGANDCKTDTEKTGRQGGWSRIFFLRKRCGCWHCCWLATREPECERPGGQRSEEHTSELQSHLNLVCRLLLEKKKKKKLTLILLNKKKKKTIIIQ